MVWFRIVAWCPGGHRAVGRTERGPFCACELVDHRRQPTMPFAFKSSRPMQGVIGSFVALPTANWFRYQLCLR